MKTKRPPALRHLAGKETFPLIKAYYEFAQLKSLYRQGWLRVGIPEEQCESVAEHSMGVTLLGLFLADEFFPELDKPRLILMGLLHDFGEIYAGDIIPGRMSLEEKHALEKESVERVFSRLPKGREYLAIWEEFEAQETPEARFMKEIDRLEMGLQATIYEQEQLGDLSIFFESTDKALSTPELRDVLAALLKLRPAAT